jgi:hypothetical protein
MKPEHELPVPEPALADPRARELVRVWAARGAQHVSIATGLWKDPAAWGVALVDLARHIARAYELTGHDGMEALERIRAGFDAEWSHPTDEPTGSLVE